MLLNLTVAYLITIVSCGPFLFLLFTLLLIVNCLCCILQLEVVLPVITSVTSVTSYYCLLSLHHFEWTKVFNATHKFTPQVLCELIRVCMLISLGNVTVAGIIKNTLNGPLIYNQYTLVKLLNVRSLVKYVHCLLCHPTQLHGCYK